MSLHWSHFLIVCPLSLLGGYVDAIAGGGGFFTLTAYLLAGLPIHNAIATNKLSSSMGTALTAARYIRRGFVPLRLVPVCVPGALLGAAVGARVALYISDALFSRIILVLLPFAAFYVLRRRDLNDGKPLSELPFVRTALVCAAISFGMGVYDGFYGPGTGTFLILLLTGLARLDLQTANGTCKVMNLSTNLASLAVYLVSGNVIYLLGLTAGVFNLCGNWLGSGAFVRRGSQLAKPMIALVLAVFFFKLLWEQFF